MGEKNGTALALVDPTPRTTRDLGGLDMVTDLASVIQLANVLGDATGFLPTWIKSHGQAVAVLLAGRELGIPPMRAFRVLHMIEGKVELAASEMLALLMRGGVSIQWVRSDHEVAHVHMERAGRPPHDETFTIEDAKRAGLTTKSIWTKYPKNMLRARAASNAARWYAPDLLGNVYVEGEIAEAIESTPAVGFTAALHEHPPAAGVFAVPPELAQQVDIAMGALMTCKSADDVHAWIDANASTISQQPPSEQKALQWKIIQRKAAGVTPPIRSDALTRAFGEALMRAQKVAGPDVVDGITEDGEVTPGARAMTELTSVETREAAMAWTEDNRDWLAGIERDSAEERIVWKAIRARVGDETAGAMEQVLS